MARGRASPAGRGSSSGRLPGPPRLLDAVSARLRLHELEGDPEPAGHTGMSVASWSGGGGGRGQCVGGDEARDPSSVTDWMMLCSSSSADFHTAPTPCLDYRQRVSPGGVSISGSKLPPPPASSKPLIELTDLGDDDDDDDDDLMLQLQVQREAVRMHALGRYNPALGQAAGGGSGTEASPANTPLVNWGPPDRESYPKEQPPAMNTGMAWEGDAEKSVGRPPAPRRSVASMLQAWNPSASAATAATTAAATSAALAAAGASWLRTAAVVAASHQPVFLNGPPATAATATSHPPMFLNGPPATATYEHGLPATAMMRDLCTSAVRVGLTRHQLQAPQGGYYSMPLQGAPGWPVAVAQMAVAGSDSMLVDDADPAASSPLQPRLQPAQLFWSQPLPLPLPFSGTLAMDVCVAEGEGYHEVPGEGGGQVPGLADVSTLGLPDNMEGWLWSELGK